jgi:CubicO group peptidase (beta-lactamase class C family)
VTSCATGLAHHGTGAATTPSTLFLIGSTTKTMTATLIAQLIADGAVALDAPVTTYVPEFATPDGDAARRITIAHLLTHTSGLDNGPYEGFGRGDGAVRRYVGRLATVPMTHAPGERFGYSNAGYVLLGRVVEAVTGQDWDTALRTRLTGPADLRTALTFPEEAMVRPFAVQHSFDGSGQPLVADRWGMAPGRAMGPTGSTLCCTAADLVRFAGLHFNDGGAVLPRAAVEMMRRPGVRLPAGIPLADRWMHGWLANEWSGGLWYGHTGHNGTSGSYLRFSPERRLAFALQFNSPGDPTLFHSLLRRVVGERYGVEVPDPWLPPARAPLDLEAYAGVYERFGVRTVVRPSGRGLMVASGPAGAAAPPEERLYVPLSASIFGAERPGRYGARPPAGMLSPELVFDGFQRGQPGYLYTAVFVSRRTAEGA